MKSIFRQLCIVLALVGRVGSATPNDLQSLDQLIAKLPQTFSGTVPSEVKSGGMYFLTPELCKQLPSCFGNNPASPYGVLGFPMATGQPALPPFEIQLVAPPGLSNYTQLREDEAFVLLGWTPTNVTYFGVTAYLAGRQLSEGAKQTVVFGAVGDTLNHRVIRTTGSKIPGENSLGQFTAIIFTSDTLADARIRSSLVALGIPLAAINTQVFPKDFPLKVGWTPTADTFSVLLRLGRPTDAAATGAYMSAPPLRVLRITPSKLAATEPFKMPALRPLGTGICEGPQDLLSGCRSSLAPNLEATLDAVEQLLRIKVGLRKMDKLVPIFLPYALTANATLGQNCASKGSNCNGDNRDTIYGLDMNKTTMSADSRDFAFIIGVNHSKVGKALYFNHAIYRMSDFAGIAGFTNFDLVQNGQSSIEYYLGRPATRLEQNLYAYKISRDCKGEPFCVQIPQSGDLGIPLAAELMITSRIYLEPATLVKPSEKEVLIHRVYRSTP
jgi:hypothetical protein